MENKTKVKIYQHAFDKEHYLLLRDNEIAFLKWLMEKCYLDNETEFKISPREDNPIEF